MKFATWAYPVGAGYKKSFSSFWVIILQRNDRAMWRRFKNEAISEGVGVAFRGVFSEALGKIGELLKSNSCFVEQAVSYFRRSFIYGRLNVFWNNTNLSTEAHVPTPRFHRRKMSDWSSRDHVTLPSSKCRQYLHSLFIPVERRLIAA